MSGLDGVAVGVGLVLIAYVLVAAVRDWQRVRAAVARLDGEAIARRALDVQARSAFDRAMGGAS